MTIYWLQYLLILYLNCLIMLMLPFYHSCIASTPFSFLIQPYSYYFSQNCLYSNQAMNFSELNQFPTINQSQIFSNFDFQNLNLNFAAQFKGQTSLDQSAIPEAQVTRLCDKHDKAKYGKKNAESNIVNQTFSFVSLKIKNHQILKKIYKGNQKKMEIYYQFLKLWKKNNKKYINRKYIKELAQFNQDHPANKLFDKINRSNLLSKNEFRRAFRILVKHYLQKICTNSIITSSKLDKQTMIDHLQRRRQVCQYFNYHMSLSGFKMRNKN